MKGQAILLKDALGQEASIRAEAKGRKRVPTPRIGLQGNPRGIQIRVTRRPGYLGGGVETPGAGWNWNPLTNTLRGLPI